MVERVGVRALQQHASEVIRRVAAGAVVEVTDRGRHVATMSAPATGGRVAELVATGQARPARRRPGDLPPPTPMPRGGTPVGDLLDEARRDER